MTRVRHLLHDGLGQVTRAWKMVIFYYLANLGMALVMALPMGLLLEDSLENRIPDATELAGFDHAWFSGLQDSTSGWTESLSPALVGAGPLLLNYERLLRGALLDLDPLLVGLGILYWLAQVFLSGGALHIFATRDGRFTLIEFFAGCGVYFFRFLRLALTSLVVIWLMYQLFLPPARFLLHGLAGDPASEQWVVLSRVLLYGCAALALLFWTMVTDYARIRTVQEQRNSVLLAILSGLYLVLKRPRKTTGLYGSILLLGLLAAVAFAFLERSLPVSSATAVVAAFLLQQAYMASKIGLKLLFYSSQLQLYRAYREQQPV